MIFSNLRERLRQYLANRILLHSAPRLPRAERRLAWATLNASDRAHLQYQGRVNEYTMLTGRAPQGVHVPHALARSINALTAEDLQAGIPQPDRRSSTYPTFAGMGHGRHPGLRRLPKPTPFNLRRFSETPPGRRAINKIKNGILRLDWEVRPCDERYQRLPGRASQQVPLDMQQRIDAVTRSLKQPNDDDTFLEVMTQVVEDVLVGGFGTLEVQPWEGNALQPFRAWPVDGMSVRINMDWGGDDCVDPQRRIRYSQALAYGGAAITTNEKVEFLDRELLYIRHDPRSNTPFGLGPCEVAFQMINAWLGHFDARERTESNDIPPFIISLGENENEHQTAAFRSYWENEIEGMGKIPILGGAKAPEAIMLRMRQMGSAVNAWPEIVLRMIAISFGLAPQTFGIEKDVNRNTSEVMQSEEFSDSVLPIVKVIEDGLTQHCIHKVCDFDDIEFRFKVKVGNEAEAAKTAVALFGADVCSLNEAREKAGMDPLSPDDARGRQFFSELQAATQAAFTPPPAAGLGTTMAGTPPHADDPLQRLLREFEQTNARVPPPQPPQPPQPIGLRTEQASSTGNGVADKRIGTPEYTQAATLMAMANAVRDALAAARDAAPVTLTAASPEQFDTLAALIATHENGHA